MSNTPARERTGSAGARSGAFSAAVLAGGASRRMGRPKPFVRLPDGRSLLEVALEALARAGASERLVVAGELAPFAAAPLPPGVRLVQDARPQRGPLGGLEAALRLAGRPWTLVVACDMPALEPERLRALLAAADDAHDAVVPLVEGRLQPLHALYHRRCLPTLQAALRAGALGLTRALADLRLRELAQPASPSFANVNTPAELARFGGAA